MSTQNHLFSRNKWSIAAAEQRHRLENEVSNMDENMLLNTPIHELCKYLAQKYRIRIPILHKDQLVINQRTGQIARNPLPTHELYNHSQLQSQLYSRATKQTQRVPGTIIEVTLPFDGDPACFHMQPTTFTFHPPNGEVQDNTIIFQLEGVGLVVDMVRAQIQRVIAEINKNLNYLQTDASRFNGNLYSYANILVAQQRKKVNSDPDASPAAGFKLKTRPENITDADTPATRQSLEPLLAPPTQREILPALGLKEYEQILHTIQNTAKTMRLSPSLLKVMDNDALRAHFLIQLNARFENKASGELFTIADDAQLGIRVEGKHIFVAACEFWTGREQCTATLNQLLAQPHWRDVKAALILFHRDHSFSDMLNALRATIRNHSNFKRERPQLSDTTYLYGFAPREDSHREIILTVLTFDVP